MNGIHSRKYISEIAAAISALLATDHSRKASAAALSVPNCHHSGTVGHGAYER